MSAFNRRTLLRWATVFSAAAAIALGGAVSPERALAASCLPGGGQGHDGYYYDPSVHPGYSWSGASAFAMVRNGATCSGVTSAQNFSNAYTMISSNPNASYYNTGWAQAGFIHTTGQGLRWFSQDNNNATGVTETRFSMFDISGEIGIRHAFHVFYLLECSCIEMYIDTTLWKSSSFSPYSYWQSPFSPQYSGEGGYANDNVPGAAASPVSMTSMGVYNEGGRNTLIPCVLSVGDDYPTRWSHHANSCTAVDLWTA